MRPKFFLLAVFTISFVIVKAGGSDPCDCEGKKCAKMGTIISSDSHKPLKDVSVTAYLASKKEKSVMTGECGGFSFDELKPGTYKFIFEKSGFKKITKENVVVKADEGFQMNIEMIQESDLDLMPSPFHFLNMN